MRLSCCHHFAACTFLLPSRAQVTSVPPGTFAFGISKAALELIANGKVVQFRLTVRYPDSSYFTNFNDM